MFILTSSPVVWGVFAIAIIIIITSDECGGQQVDEEASSCSLGSWLLIRVEFNCSTSPSMTPQCVYASSFIIDLLDEK